MNVQARTRNCMPASGADMNLMSESRFRGARRVPSSVKELEPPTRPGENRKTTLSLAPHSLQWPRTLLPIVRPERWGRQSIPVEERGLRRIAESISDRLGGDYYGT